MDLEANKTRFLSILRDKVHRDGVEDLIQWIEGSDFFEAPASARFHGNYAGGLCEHSLNVYDCLVTITERYPQFPYSDESIAISALCHDLTKANTMRLGKRNVKNPETGKWEAKDVYEHHILFPGGHGEKSCFILQNFIRITPDEYLAVRWHMGGYDTAVKGGDRSCSEACEKCKLAAMLHIADMEASQLMEVTVL